MWDPRSPRCVTGMALPLHVRNGFTRIVNGEKVRALGHAIAQSICRRIPTTVARVRSEIKSCGNFGGHWSKFSLNTSVSPTHSHFLPYSSSLSSWAGATCPIAVVAPDRPYLTPSMKKSGFAYFKAFFEHSCREWRKLKTSGYTILDGPRFQTGTSVIKTKKSFRYTKGG
jgi:hypothetical protein